MPLPPLLVSLFLKHFTLGNIYVAAETYGFHRIYRRLIEGMKIVKIPKDQQRVIKYHIKSGMRAPSSTLQHISNSETASFVIKYSEYIAKQANPYIPSFFVTAVKMLYKETPFGKAIDMLERISKKK